VTPTARTLAFLRKAGWLAWVVEKWIPQTRQRSDLFGFIDVLAIREGETLAVQSTSGSNVSSRVKKITEHENVARVRAAGWAIHVHGWRKNAKGRWELREVDLS
jgi:carbonic anhydrase